MNQELSDTLLEKLLVLEQGSNDLYHKIRALFSLLDYYIDEVLISEQIHFTTLFTKISYLGLKHQLPKKLVYFLHRYRKDLETLDETNANSEKYNIAKYVLIFTIKEIEKKQIEGRFLNLYKEPEYTLKKPDKVQERIRFARVSVFELQEETNTLKGINEALPEEEIYIRMNVTGKNDDYNSLLKFLKRSKHFPVVLHLEDIEVIEENVYVPSRVVFEPDYLMDVTTIAECFKPNESNPLFYFIKKFFPVYQNKYLVIGNMANFFLDELFNNPDVEFEPLILQTFKLSPLGFTMMDDIELREVINTLKLHYFVIRRTIKQQFPIHNITREDTFLEPSFFSPIFGIQGRLDLYTINEKENDAKIIELKSGKPYKTNTYGLNINHYVQTLLYNLMVSSVAEGKLKISSFILYSSQEEDALRFAPPLQIQQKEAIKLRNQLVEIDYLLADRAVGNDQLFKFISEEYVSSDGFIKRDVALFEKVYGSASQLSRKYFNAFAEFIAREQILSKTGEFGMDKSSGLAGLWLDDMQEKIDNFRVLNALKLMVIKDEQKETIIQFERTASTALHANFRIGDVVVLYPFNQGNQSVIRNQIFKSSIIDLDPNSVTVRLRNKQNNVRIFYNEKVWHIEHDHLDHGFNYMYQDIFQLLRSGSDYQELILGSRPPSQTMLADIPFDKGVMTDEQQNILREMVAAKDYYLLWGPPGTGKTSVILHSYLKYIYQQTSEVTLVLAYTNKAVDEICSAIDAIGDDINKHYFRIGSRYSTNEKYRANLLDAKLDPIEKRSDFLEMLGNSRIIVSTLASIHGKKDLLSLIKIDTIVVDEASQILEPQLAGFLSNAKKRILIGDHNQLPAIVLQRPNESEVKDESLNGIGLFDRRNSLFERLFKRCEEMKWTWATGRLTAQGRMHEHIMDFANRHFYKGLLQCIENLDHLNGHSPLYGKNIIKDSQLITKKRMLFIPCEIDNQSINFKTNEDEAAKVVRILKSIQKLYELNNLVFHEESIGVITPYRAQISAILAKVHEAGITMPITVDTVERYQGGARDIIIISFCLNLESQIYQLVNLSDEGIDRKLNVAMTRARKQIIILGNGGLMAKNNVYADLIKSCSTMELTPQ